MEVRVLFGAAVAVAALLLVPTAPAAIAPLRWCGNDLAQADRVHDRMGGEQIHVIYALPADGPDRFAELASSIATDVAAIDAWWRREDPTRAPRFDLFDFPGCESRFGNLDLSFVRLPDPTSVYLPDLDRFQRIATQLASPPFDFAAFDKKYLVFYDGVVAESRVCGTGSGGRTTGGRLSYGIVYLRSGCDLTIGDGGGAAYVGAHELLHALGALPPGAPHPCPGDDGHPCDSSVDVLATFYRGGPLDSATLDVNRDDYYAHAGSWFDIQDSRWLLHADTQVRLSLSVVGSGFVTSGVNGQECDGSCTTEWDAGTDIELVADALPGVRLRLVDRRVRRDLRIDVLGRARGDDRGRRRLSASPSARTPDHGARHRHELGRALLPLVLDTAGRGVAGRAPREGREGLAVRPLERRLPWDSPRLHRPARHRRHEGRGRVRPARVTEPGLAALCPRWARCAC